MKISAKFRSESLNGKCQLRYVDIGGEIILKRLFNMVWRSGLHVAGSSLLYNRHTERQRNSKCTYANHALSWNYRINCYACEQWMLMQRQVSQNLFFSCSPSFIFTKSVRSFLCLHMSFPCLQCLANGDLFIDILLIDLFEFGTWLIDWLTNYLWTESSSRCKVILFISGLYGSHSIRTHKFAANLCRQATYKMTLCVFLRRTSSCLICRVCFYAETNVSR
jgi:hypothetical protein